MSINERAKQAFIDEVLDPNKIILYCRDHGYYGPGMKLSGLLHQPGMMIRNAPMQGCVKCWQVYFMHEIGNAPPEKRAEMLDELERNIYNAAQLEDAGLFDFNVSRHPEIKIEKGD